MFGKKNEPLALINLKKKKTHFFCIFEILRVLAGAKRFIDIQSVLVLRDPKV